MDNSNFWPAVAALGQWACAAATLYAVHVALKPYKWGFHVSLDQLTLIMGDEKQIIPMCIKIKNDGYAEATVKTIGIAEGKYQVILFDDPVTVEAQGVNTVGIGSDTLVDAFTFKDIDHFRIYIEDSKGNEYFSKRYEKKPFMENEDIFKIGK